MHFRGSSVVSSVVTCDLTGVEWRLHLQNSAELMLLRHHLHDALSDAGHGRLCGLRRGKGSCGWGPW